MPLGDKSFRVAHDFREEERGDNSYKERRGIEPKECDRSAMRTLDNPVVERVSSK